MEAIKNITEKEQLVKNEIAMNEAMDNDTVVEAIAQEEFDDELNESDDATITENGKELYKALGKYLNFAS